MEFGNVRVFCLPVSLGFKYYALSLKVAEPSNVNSALGLPPTGIVFVCSLHREL